MTIDRPTDADVVTAAGEVRAVWQAKEFSDAHHRYMIARLEYEWPTLALAIKRLCSKHEDATRCPSEYQGAGYEAGTVACDRGRDHAGAHEGEGYDSERYQWQREGQQYVPVTCGVKHPHAKHDWHVCERVPGHDGDHRDPNSNTWPWQPADTYCYQKGPADHQGACLIPKAHFGDHRDSQGNTWPAQCGAKHPTGGAGDCVRTHGHAGDHSYAGIYWKQAQHVGPGEILIDAPDCGATRPRDPRAIACTRPPGHWGQHHNRAGNIGYQWDGDGRDLPVCGVRAPEHWDGPLPTCILTAGHAGHHEAEADVNTWPQDS